MEKIYNEKYKETYYKTTLDNGLTVILWHKPEYEKNLFMMATPFGAAHLFQKDSCGNIIEHPSGIAHFLEHKMFTYKNEDVMEKFSTIGADVNAFTSYYETVYYTSTTNTPTMALELLMDFVQTLEIDDASVEKEKGIIIQELHMYKEQSEHRLLMEMYRCLFHKHPIHIDIGGSDESVNQTTKEDLYRCYHLNYHPSRMVLVGISGQDPNELLTVISNNQNNKKFSLMKPITDILLEEPKQVVDSHYRFEMDISQEKICIAYKQSPIMDPIQRLQQEWAIRFLLETHFSSLNSQYQNWINDEIISDYCGCDVDYGDGYGYIMFFTETKHIQKFIDLIDSIMDQILSSEITTLQMDQLKRRFYAQHIRSLNSFDEIAITTIRSHFEKRDMFSSIDCINSITKDKIIEASSILSKEYRTIIELHPNLHKKTKFD